jgi:hypothetical protein
MCIILYIEGYTNFLFNAEKGKDQKKDEIQEVQWVMGVKQEKRRLQQNI